MSSASKNSPQRKRAAANNKAASISTSKGSASTKRPVTVPQTRRERIEEAKAKAARRSQPQNIGDYLSKISSGAWTVIIAGLLVVVIIIFAVLTNRPSPSTGSSNVGELKQVTPLAVGAKAPAIDALEQPDGTKFDPSTVIGTKVVLLEFFAPWCPVCRAETSVLNQLQSDIGNSNFQIISVSASPYGKNYEDSGKTDTTPISMDDMKWYHDTYHIIFPELFDPSMKTVNTYGLLSGYPTFYLINKQGVITYTKDGGLSLDDLKTQVNNALKG
jgi:thiol-disulfide isomerase/thioredoxin/uncharacterized integral membrane protein